MRYFLLFLSLLATQFIGFSQPNKGVITGKIINRETLEPIAAAIVTVEKNSSLGAITTATGDFRIERVKTGYQSLRVSAFGFIPMVSDNFLVSVSSNQEVEILLEPLSVNIEEVVVTSSPYRNIIDAPISNFSVKKQEIEKTPGGNRDISKVVQISPGVITTPSFRNDLLVRGGGANENKYYLDGIEIPILNHFAVQGGTGGNASLVNTDFLSKATFYASGFPLATSGALSSVLDMELMDGNTEQFKGKFTIGASDFGASFDTPISKDGKTTMLGSYRRSYLQFLFSYLGLPFLPTYNDYQLKINHKIDKKNEISFLLIGSFDQNRLNSDIPDANDEDRYLLGYIPENNQNSYTMGVVYNRKINNNSSLRLVLSRNYFKNYLYKYKDNNSSLSKIVDIDSKESDNRFRAEYKFTNAKRYNFLIGTSADFGKYDSQNYQQLYINNQFTEQNFSSEFNKIDYGVFSSVSKSYFDGHLSMSLGLRLDGSSYNEETSNPLRQFSPRLGAIYRIDEKWSLKSYISRYFALPSYTTLGYSNDKGELVNKENGLEYISTTHFVAGVTFSPNLLSKLSLEGFYKIYDNFPVSLIDNFPISTSNFEDYTIGDVPVKSIGKGRAYGFELGYRNSDLKNTVVNASYTFLYSQFQELDSNLTPTGKYISSGWDIRNMFNLVAIHSFSRNWDLGFKWRFSSGAPYTPYDEELSSLIQAWDARGRPYSDNSRYNNYKYEPYHQLDIRVDKSYFFDKWSLGLYIDIQNIYNYQAYGQDLLIPVTNDDGSYKIDPNDPSRYLMKRIANTISGTVLPTIGLIIEF